MALMTAEDVSLDVQGWQMAGHALTFQEEIQLVPSFVGMGESYFLRLVMTDLLVMVLLIQ